MSVLNSLFDVVRGHTPAVDAATIQENYKPATAYVPAEGDVVDITVASGEPRIQLASPAALTGAGSVDALAALIGDTPHLWLVVSGMQPTTDFDGVFTGKAVAILGTYMVKTTNFEGADTYAIGGPVTVAAGIVRSNPISAVFHHKYGEVIEDNSATTGDLIIAVN